MRFSYYNHSPERVNPQFIGIATKFSDHKRKRLNIEKRKKQLDSDVCYTSKLDQTLQKDLQNKLTQLQRLQQARQRHLDDIKYKQQLQEKRRIQLQNLKERNTQNRITMKMNISDAKSSLYQRNKTNKQQLQLDLSRMSQRFEQFLESKYYQNHMKYNESKEQKKLGRHRINSFHRERNRESLNSYLNKIKKQQKLKKDHTRKIKAHQSRLQQLSKTVEFKKSYLDQIQNEIFKYRTDLKSIILSPPRSRKYTQTNKSQSRFLPGQYSQILKGKQISDIQN